MAQKVWRVSQILQMSPFPGDLIDHTEAELDFVLEMYAADHPDQYRFTRNNGAPAPLTESERLAAWDRVLVGKAKDKILPVLPLDAIRAFNKNSSKLMKMMQAAARNG